MHWIDIGANLTDKRLDLGSVLSRANEAQVRQLIITGTSIESSQKAANMATVSPQSLFSTAGIHPHHAKDFSADSLSLLKDLAQAQQVVAIGECGLDFNRNFSTPEQQLYAFEQQLILACDLGLPVFLHERDAFDQQIRLLSKYRNQLKGGVVHCFTGDEKQMHQYLDLDLYIGITGWVCDLKRGEALRQAVKSLPIERLLLETDAPYLRPKGLANNRKIDKGNNEPAYLPYIAEHLADLMTVGVETLQKNSFKNTRDLFALPLQESINAS